MNGDNESLDNWSAPPRKKKLIMSEWRQRQNAGKNNLKPGVDEVRKIKMHLNNNHADAEIMKAFGISKRTLNGIKDGSYVLYSKE